VLVKSEPESVGDVRTANLELSLVGAFATVVSMDRRNAPESAQAGLTWG
jgi:hypothetical protein